MDLIRYRARLYPVKPGASEDEKDEYYDYEDLLDEHGWIYGGLLYFGKQPYLVGDFEDVTDDYCIPGFCNPINEKYVNGTIDAKTLCAGITVSNKLTIFRGDIISTNNANKVSRYEIYSTKFGLAAKNISTGVTRNLDRKDVINESTCVIGNKFENPELLKNNIKQKMKFYRFRKPFRSLIAATSEEKALQIYKNEHDEVDDNDDVICDEVRRVRNLFFEERALLFPYLAADNSEIKQDLCDEAVFRERVLIDEDDFKYMEKIFWTDDLDDWED